MLNENKNIPQGIIIQDRKQANISGVIDVGSMDENTVVLETVLGELTVKGENLKIVSFSGQTGDLVMTGSIIAVGFTDTVRKGGFFSRIIK